MIKRFEADKIEAFEMKHNKWIEPVGNETFLLHCSTVFQIPNNFLSKFMNFSMKSVRKVRVDFGEFPEIPTNTHCSRTST